MADELRINLAVAYTNGSDTEAMALTETDTVGSQGRVSETQNINSTWEALNKGGLGNIGEVIVQNLDATKYVEISFDAGATVASRIPAGRFAKIPAKNGTTAVHGQFQTSAAWLKFWLFSA